MNAGHAHADALAVTLHARARPLACGSRHRHLHDGSRLARSTPLDRAAQHGHGGWAIAVRTRGSIPLDACRRRSRRARGRRRTFDLFHAIDGRICAGAPRALVFATGAHTWIVADRLAGPGRHRASVHWHIRSRMGRRGRRPRRLGADASTAAPRRACRRQMRRWSVFRARRATGAGVGRPDLRPRDPGDHAARDGRTGPRRSGWSPRLTWPIPTVVEAVTSLLDVLSGDPGSSRMCRSDAARAARRGHGASAPARERDTVTVAIEPRGSVALTTDAAALHARISVTRTAGTRVPRRCDRVPIRWDRARDDHVAQPGRGSGRPPGRGPGPGDRDREPTCTISRSRTIVPPRRHARARATRRSTRVAAVRMSCAESPASPTR